VADTALEVYPSSFDLVKHVLLAYQRSSCSFGSSSGARVRVGDHTDAQVGFDRMWKAHAIADYSAVFGCFELDVELVFGGIGCAADFCCAQVS